VGRIRENKVFDGVNNLFHLAVIRSGYIALRCEVEGKVLADACAVIAVLVWQY
jgi:hypothetical protein